MHITGCRLTSALLLLAVSAVGAVPQWSQMGQPMQHANVVALSSCLQGGTPTLAYGASDSPDDTTIYFMAYSGTGWEQVATHTPQFAQPYEHFDLRCSGEASGLYLGLVINPSDSGAAGLSSILKRVPAGGGEDGFEGCYAFEGEVFDFVITSQGDVRMAVVGAGNHSLGLTAYAKAGWSAYPASDTWGPTHTVVNSSAAALTQVRMAAAGAGQVLVSYLTQAGAAPRLRVAQTTLAEGAQWLDLGEPFAGAAGEALVAAPSGLAWVGGVPGAPTPLLCAAATAASGASALVACAAANGTAQWGSPVEALQGGLLLAAAGAQLAAITTASRQRLLLVAALAEDRMAVHTAACTVAAGAGSSSCCSSGSSWVQLGAIALGSACNSFQLASNASALFLTASIGPSDSTGDAVVAFQLAL
jgi:hypothetical protein